MNTIAAVCCAVLLFQATASARIRVVATTQDLAAIAQAIGGDSVDITAIAKGYQDPHFVDPKPSYLLKLRNADLLMVVGLELEVGWLPPLLQNARNSRILPGNPGFLDASDGCTILQKPQGRIDRSMGDIHPYGNPHYWTDPENGRIIARHIADTLSDLDPPQASSYADRLKQFESQLTEKEKQWHQIAGAFKGVQVITYHNSWPNFCRVFGMVVANHVEPKPGIPPSPGHVRDLEDQIKAEKIPLILVEPYFDQKLPQKIAHETGATLLMFPPSVGGVSSIQTYFDLFDYDLGLLKHALSGQR